MQTETTSPDSAAKALKAREDRNKKRSRREKKKYEAEQKRLREHEKRAQARAEKHAEAHGKAKEEIIQSKAQKEAEVQMRREERYLTKEYNGLQDQLRIANQNVELAGLAIERAKESQDRWIAETKVREAKLALFDEEVKDWEENGIIRGEVLEGTYAVGDLVKLTNNYVTYGFTFEHVREGQTPYGKVVEVIVTGEGEKKDTELRVQVLDLPARREVLKAKAGAVAKAEATETTGEAAAASLEDAAPQSLEVAAEPPAQEA